MDRAVKNTGLAAAAIGLLMILGCRSSEQIPAFARILEKKIPELMTQAHIPGLSIAVIKNGDVIWTGAYGVRRTGEQDRIDGETMFESASLSKPVTTYTVLRLVEKGIMNLDTPLADYYPYEKLAGDDRYKKLTARIVLTHTTGLPNWGTRFVREPGERYGYSGEGFLYLGRTAEKLTGLNLHQLAKREVFDPLGMEHTSYVWTESYNLNGASGHDRHGFPNPKRRTTEPNGGASLLSTARDYAVFVSAILNGTGLSQATIKEMISPHVKAEDRGPKAIQEKISWGWGWGVMPSETGKAFWHWGNNGDLRGYVVAYPDRAEGVVFFANSENLFFISESIISEIFPDKQWAFDWMEVASLDDPVRSASMDIEEDFLRDRGGAGIEKLRAVMASQPELLDERQIRNIAYYISEKGKKEEAAEILGINLEKHSESLLSHYLLGTIQHDLGKNEAALKKMEDCLAINPKFLRALKGRDWILIALEAGKNPIVLPSDRINSYAGDYGPRHIRFRDSVLYYQREGGEEYRLIPLKADLFALQGNGSFRIQFVKDEEGRITEIIGHYLDRQSDHSPKNIEDKVQP